MSGELRGAEPAGERAARSLVRIIGALTIGSLIILAGTLVGTLLLSSQVEQSLRSQRTISDLAQNVRDVDMRHDAIAAAVYQARANPGEAAKVLPGLRTDADLIQANTAAWPELSAEVNDPLIADAMPPAADEIASFAVLGEELVSDPAKLADPALIEDFSTAYDNVGAELASIVASINAQQAAEAEAFDATSDLARVIVIVAVVALAAVAAILGLVALARARYLARAMTTTLGELETETAGRRIDAELREGLDLVETEEQTIGVIEAWLPSGFPKSRSEVLLTDPSRAHLRVVATYGTAGSPCTVQTPSGCPAMRRATPLAMPDSMSPNACPHLRERGPGLAAACAPITFGSRTIGVLHVVGTEPSKECYDRAGATAALVGVRLGSLRAFGSAKLQASTDSLTGLFNRRASEQALSRLIDFDEPLVLAMVDLDHFKQLNDVHGHHVGDLALRTFATAVRQTLRDDDIAGRFGGEEFVLAFSGATMEQAVAVIDRLRERLPVACVESATPPFTFSAGLAERDDQSTVLDLLRLADQRLLAAKAAGRDRTVTTSGT